jgi:hypothetical protein
MVNIQYITFMGMMLRTVMSKAESATGSGQLSAGGSCTYQCRESSFIFSELLYTRLLYIKHTLHTPVPVAGADWGVNEPVPSALRNRAEVATKGFPDIVIFRMLQRYVQRVT